MEIGTRLQRAREARGKTQQQVADHLNVSRQAINDTESRANLETDTITRYLGAINSTYPQLFESHIPRQLHDKHWLLHEMLQEILDAEEEIGGKWSVGITANIESLHRSTVDDLRRARRKKQIKTEGETEAPGAPAAAHVRPAG